MLVPATPDDLKVAGKITVAPNSETTSVKTVQIKVCNSKWFVLVFMRQLCLFVSYSDSQVPVVATVIQTFDEMGKMRIDVEPPGPELENQNNELHKNSKKNVMYKVEPGKLWWSGGLKTRDGERSPWPNFSVSFRDILWTYGMRKRKQSRISSAGRDGKRSGTATVSHKVLNRILEQQRSDSDSPASLFFFSC